MTIDFTKWGIRIRRLRQRGDEAPQEVESEGPLLGLTESGEEVHWPGLRPDRGAGHILFLGASGSGKSELLAFALATIMTRGHTDHNNGPSIFVTDPKIDSWRDILEQKLPLCVVLRILIL